jgi:hypothetical protein
VPIKDGTRAFVAKWFLDREAALNNPPKRPCWMLTSAGTYVCYREGCVQPHGYFNSQ